MVNSFHLLDIILLHTCKKDGSVAGKFKANCQVTILSFHLFGIITHLQKMGVMYYNTSAAFASIILTCLNMSSYLCNY